MLVNVFVGGPPNYEAYVNGLSNGHKIPKWRVVKYMEHKVKRDMSIGHQAAKNREWYDLITDIERYTGMTFQEVLNGYKKGFVFVMPDNGYVSPTENGVPTKFVETGYGAAKRQFLQYQEAQQPIQVMLRKAEHMYREFFIGAINLQTHSLIHPIISSFRP